MAVKKKTDKKPKTTSKKQPDGWIATNDCRWQKKARYFQEQCFLVDLWSGDSSKFENYSTSLSGKSKKQKIQIDQNKLHGYNNFIILESGAHEKVLELVMENKAKDILSFQKFKPVHLSALIPKLRLYKVLYDSKKNPLIKIPIFFPTSLGVLDPKEGSKEGSLEKAILAGASTGGVGLESFSWKLNGTDPVSADFVIEANLSLFMQNLGDLETPLPLDSRTLSKLKNAKDFASYSPKYRDLLLPPDMAKFKTTSPTPGGNQEHIPDYFRIKAEVGWNLPTNPEAFFSGLSKEEVEDFKQAVNNTSITLDLNLIDHTINFGQMGDLKINISYHAAFEANMSSPDAELLIDSKIRKAINEYNKAEKEALKKIKDIKKRGVSKAKNKSEIDKIDKTFKKVKKELEDAKKERKFHIYKQLIQNIEDEGRVFTCLYDTKAIAAKFDNTGGDPKLFQNFYSKYAAKIRNQYIKSLGKPWPKFLIQKSNENLTAVGALQREKRRTKLKKLLARKNISDKQKQKIKESLKKLDMDKNANVSGIRWVIKKERTKAGKGKKVGRPLYELSFFFLGDLINSALKIAKSNSDENSNFFANTEFMFSDVQYFDPRGNGGRGAIVSKNLADIPISYSLFREWFNDSVVKKNLNRYKLYDFFKDLFSGLLSDALGGKCYDGLSFGAKPNTVGIHHFTTKVPNKKSSKDPLKNIGTNPAYLTARATYNRLNLDSGLINKFHENLDQGGTSKTKNWIVFYVSNNSVTKRTGNVTEDYFSGIPHFYVGSDTGILKTMSFAKENWQYYKELRLTQKSGYSKLGTPYQVNITTFGQPNFKPGQYIYINPRRPGITSNIGKELLLEGYYLIISVDSNISAGSFETKFNAKFETTGRDLKTIVYNSKNTEVPDIKRQKKTVSQVQRKKTTKVQKAKKK